MEWITIQKLAELTGYTVSALRAKIARGEFIDGVHFRHSPDGRVHFNVKVYQQWVLGEKPELKHAA